MAEDTLTTLQQMVRERAQAAWELQYRFPLEADTYKSEALGLSLSLDYTKPFQYSSHPRIQKAFERGFADGRELLSLAEVAA